MMPLSLKTLIYDWRRFAPAVVAVAFSGLLVLLQAAIILGIFSLSSVYVTRSSADLWIGYPGVQSIDLGQPIATRSALFAWSDPRVRAIEPLFWGSGAWRTTTHGSVNVYLVGVSTAGDAMALSDTLTPALRAAIADPAAVVVDEADLHKLEANVGDEAIINGRTVRIVGVTRGLRGLGGVNVIASLATARRLDPSASPEGKAAYLLARIADPAAARQVAEDINAGGPGRGYEAIAAKDFAQRTTRYWLLESGAGVAFVFGSAISILVSVVITSQTLTAAVAGSLKEYAALRALGFSMSALRRIVVAQSAWVGLAGLVAAIGMTVLLVLAARASQAPIVLSGGMAAAAAALIMATALGSGAFALRRVGRADPAVLLL